MNVLRQAWFICAIVWVGMVLMYLAFAVNVGYRELVASAISAGIATYAAMAYAGHQELSFRFKLAWLAKAGPVVVAILKDTLVVLGQLPGRLAGKIVPSANKTVGFDGGRDDPLSHGRRAITVTYMTLTPNNVVLDLCPDSSTLTYHELAPEPLSNFAIEMGAKPEVRK